VKPCLIFDLDGTLVDSLDGIAASLNRSLSAHGLPGHSHANVRSFVGDGLRILVERAAPRGADFSLIESLIALFKKDYDQSWQHGTTAYPGIHNLLDELQKDGFAMAVLSNKTHDFTVAMTRALFPKIHFASILGQRDGRVPDRRSSRRSSGKLPHHRGLDHRHGNRRQRRHETHRRHMGIP
jgi:phosphoglycolate phosphatase